VNVVAFRPRPGDDEPRGAEEGIPITGVLRSPNGRGGHLVGRFRVRRLVLAPRGAFVTGVVTGEMCDAEGVSIGVASRRVTAAADLLRTPDGLRPTVHALQLDLMGIPVTLHEFTIDPGVVLPRVHNRHRASQVRLELRRSQVRSAGGETAGRGGLRPVP